MTPNADSAGHRYYRGLEAAWSGTYRLRITDWGAFRAAKLSAWDRLVLLNMLFFTGVFGPLRMSTTVDYQTGAARGEIAHTTRLHKWGVSFFRSAETICLIDHGRALKMPGVQRELPLWWQARSVVDDGEVNEDARGATYLLNVMGGKVLQVAAIEADPTIAGVPAVRLIQTTAYSRGEVLLIRQGA